MFGFIDLANYESDIDKVKQHLSKAMNAMQRARGLTHQLLTFATGGEPIREIVDLYAFAKEAIPFALSGSNVLCNFTVQENLWVCSFDRNQIGQVLDNIVINAAQAMPGGGVIEISFTNVSISEREHAVLIAGDYVKISIKDTGIGIPEHILPLIFDPFFTTKTKGHGLGLATSYSIVGRHGGCIEVESAPGNGSLFQIYLPASKEQTSPADPASLTLHKGSGTFVLMDDDPSMMESMEAMLELLGYTVVCTNNGRDAVRFLSSEIDAKRNVAGMIFDLTVPGGMGGKEAIQEVRKISAGTPVFVISGYAEDPIMANPKDYGFTASICKPFTMQELTNILNKYIKRG